MVKKAKAKGNSKKGSAKPRATTRPSGASAKAASKYDQPGAPWWKKLGLPLPK